MDYRRFRHTEVDGNSSKKVEEKWCEGSVGLSLDYRPRKSISWKVQNWDQITPSNSSRARVGSTPSFIERVNFVGAIRVLQDLGKEHKTTLCNKKVSPGE